MLGVSGRLMLDVLVSGTRNPEVLAALAKGALHRKIPAPKQALAATFKPHHTLIGSHIPRPPRRPRRGDREPQRGGPQRRLAPFAHKAEPLSTITGVAARNSQVILAELGPDMTRFPSHRHAAELARDLPANDELSALTPIALKRRRSDCSHAMENFLRWGLRSGWGSSGGW